MLQLIFFTTQMIERTHLILLITLLTFNYGFTQNKPTEPLDRLEFADTQPRPIGGSEAVLKWLSEQKKKSDTIFTRTDTLDCSTLSGGKVFVAYTVTKDGKLSNIQIVRGLGEPYDSYCIGLLEQLPVAW
ncbi:MAG: hypothetical protein JXR10_11190 [Cyclobacteriaceae bacterium]